LLGILPDGTRLVHWDHYNHLRSFYSDKELAALKIQKISPNFRVIATGALPSEKSDYVTSEISEIFAFHVVPELPFSEMVSLLRECAPSAPVPVLKKITDFSRKFNENREFRQTPFTLRHCIRLVEKLFDSGRRTVLLEGKGGKVRGEGQEGVRGRARGKSKRGMTREVG
jgi:hypothetical protein